MAITAIEQRSYECVTASTTVDHDYVIPDGAVLTIDRLGGNAPTANSYSYFAIIWDPAGDNTMLFGTYSAGFQFCNINLLGDGSKVVRLKLVNNDPLAARIVGGFYSGTLITED